MKAPRFSCRCRLSALVTKARELAQAPAHRRAETACLAGLSLLLATAAYLR